MIRGQPDSERHCRVRSKFRSPLLKVWRRSTVLWDRGDCCQQQRCSLHANAASPKFNASQQRQPV